MSGEMYVLVAIRVTASITSGGPIRYPTRIPGQIVFENDDAYTTRSGSIDSIVGSDWPLKRSAT